MAACYELEIDPDSVSPKTLLHPAYFQVSPTLNSGTTLSLFRRILGLVALAMVVLTDLGIASADPATAFSWKEIEPGYSVARYEVTAPGSVLRSQIALAKFDPKIFSLIPVRAIDLGSLRSDVRSLTESVNGVAGINANFFDTVGSALGVVTINGKQKNKLHLGGNALTGIFYLTGDSYRIAHRNDLPKSGVISAIQAGPRLVVDGKAVMVESPFLSTRRSGVAVTKSHQVIFFATMLRFPGASFNDVQQMLLRPELEITDALNLDGGGSSQLFLKRGESDGSDLLVSGGDVVPIGLVAVKKGPSEH